MDLLRRTQELEKQKNLLYGILLVVMGIALQALSHTLGGSNVKDFFLDYCWEYQLLKCWLVFLWLENA